MADTKTDKPSTASEMGMRAATKILGMPLSAGDHNSIAHAAQTIDREYAPLMQLIEEAIPYVEESEQFNKPTRRDLSKRLRSALSETTKPAEEREA